MYASQDLHHSQDFCQPRFTPVKICSLTCILQWSYVECLRKPGSLKKALAHKKLAAKEGLKRLLIFWLSGSNINIDNLGFQFLPCLRYYP